MNDPRSAGRPVRSGTRTRPADPEARRRAELRRRKKRRAQQIRRFKIFVVSCLILVILISLGVGYLIGFRVGKASAAGTRIPAASDPPVQTQPVSQSQPAADPQSSQPSEPAEPSDTVAPRILGVNPLSLFVGGTVAYRSGILVTDDTDPAPKLTVDSFQVNLSAPGVYPLFYTATDSAGNVTTLETTVTVSEAPESYVDEALINETADKLLEKILTDGQTPEEQVNTIYDWIESHCYYIADFDKTDYMQAAYLMMTNNRGDCFGFYALSRLLFDRLGYPNLTVTRMSNTVRTTNHWWNMVSLDGGETWYHFDSTPHMTYPTRTCLITDADLEAFNELMPNYYFYDHASFPKTPEA